MAGLLIATALASVIQASSAPDDVCYDLAIAGHIRHADRFAGLDQFVPLEPNEISFGGRWDVDIDVDQVFEGSLKPSVLKARVVLTTMFSPEARLLILLKNGPVDPNKDDTVRQWNGRYIPRPSNDRPWSVVLVQSLRAGFNAHDPSFPPRCA